MTQKTKLAEALQRIAILEEDLRVARGAIARQRAEAEYMEQIIAEYEAEGVEITASN